MNYICRTAHHLGRLNHYAPLLLAGAVVLLRGAQNVHEYLQARKLPDVDAETQRIFNEVVRECGLKERDFSCKIYDAYNSWARSIGNHVVTITSETASHLKGSDPRARLQARSIIKHELGHLHHRDLISRTLISAAVAGIIYGMNKIAEHYIPAVQSPWTALAYSIGAVFALYVRLRLIWEGQLYALRREERRADLFAIQHTTNPQELDAVAEQFSSEFEGYVGRVLFLQVGRRKIQDEYDRRSNRDQSVRDWVIENRHVPYIAGESSIHPNLYDRANTFKEAAKRLLASKLSSC